MFKETNIFSAIKLPYIFEKIFGATHYTITGTENQRVKPTKYDDGFRLMKTLLIFYLFRYHNEILKTEIERMKTIKYEVYFSTFLFSFLFVILTIVYLKFSYFDRAKICCLFNETNKIFNRCVKFNVHFLKKLRKQCFLLVFFSYLPELFHFTINYVVNKYYYTWYLKLHCFEIFLLFLG